MDQHETISRRSFVGKVGLGAGAVAAAIPGIAAADSGLSGFLSALGGGGSTTETETETETETTSDSSTGLLAALARWMDTQDMVYSDEGDRLKVPFDADNDSDGITITAFADEERSMLNLRDWGIGNCASDDAFYEAIWQCNELNNQYILAKFCVDSDRDISVEMDAIVTLDTVGPVGEELIRRMVSIIDDALPVFQAINGIQLY